MSIKLTQALVNKAQEDHEPGTQLYDAEVKGLRLVVGQRSCSYKYVGRINDGTDRYVSIIVGRADEVSLKTARELSAAHRLTLKRGSDPRTPKACVPTVQEALDRYLEARGDELRPKTQDWYRAKLKGPLRSLAKIPMDRIDREQVRGLHEKLTRQKGAYCANGAMRVLKLLYNDTARSHDLPPNPVSRAVRMNREKARDWAIRPDELPLLWNRLDAMEDTVRAACWMTMLLTGLRRNDVLTMRWENLDKDGVLFVPSPKGGPDRSFRIPLPRVLLQRLEHVRQETAPLESPFVFPLPSSKAGHIQEMRRIKEFPYSPHQMRHTYRTVALEAGIDLQTTMALMNHRPAGVSWNYLTRAHLIGHMKKAQEAISEERQSFRRVAV